MVLSYNLYVLQCINTSQCIPVSKTRLKHIRLVLKVSISRNYSLVKTVTLSSQRRVSGR